MVATSGPVPARTEERRRVNNEDGQLDVDKVTLTEPVEIPLANPEWHPGAVRWYESLARSGQSRFYEPSDWELAWLLAEQLSRHLHPQFVGFRQTGRDETEAEFIEVPINGSTMAAILKAMSALLVTEADRRRMRVEITRAQFAELPEDVPDIAEQRARRFAGGSA